MFYFIVCINALDLKPDYLAFDDWDDKESHLKMFVTFLLQMKVSLLEYYKKNFLQYKNSAN